MFFVTERLEETAFDFLKILQLLFDYIVFIKMEAQKIVNLLNDTDN